MAAKKSKLKSILTKQVSLGGTSVVDLVMLTKHLSVMLSAGMNIPEALDIIVEQANGSLKRVLNRVYRRVKGGSSFGDALIKEPKTFSPVFVSASVIGESSGTLAQNLERLAIQMEKDLELRRQIQSASLYPLIIFSAAMLLGLGIATFVLPNIISVFSSLGTELPATTQVIIWMSEIFGQHGVWLSPLIVVVLIASLITLKQKFLHPITHRVMLLAPGIKTFTHNINRARFCRTLGTLLESGTPIQEALEITEEVVSNVVYKSSVKHMVEDIGSGESLGDIIKDFDRLYPKMITRMVAVGEESGGLGKTLMYLADYYEEQVYSMSKNLGSIIEPVLLIVIGLVIAVLAVSVISPIYSITSSVVI